MADVAGGNGSANDVGVVASSDPDSYAAAYAAATAARDAERRTREERIAAAYAVALAHDEHMAACPICARIREAIAL
jgi:hypothetical protein